MGPPRLRPGLAAGGRRREARQWRRPSRYRCRQTLRGAEKIYSGISSKLAPGADKLQAGAGELAQGAVKIETDVNSKLAPGVYKVDNGAQKLAAGAVQLSAALTPTPCNAENNLADGATQLDGGAAQLAAGSVVLAAGTDQLKGYRGANANPEAGTGTAALAQAMELLQAAANDPVQGLVPLSVVKDKIAKITAGAHKLDAGASQLRAGAQRLRDGAGLLNGSRALASGASELSAGNTKLASGSSQLATGADKLADGNARIADGTGTLYSGAAAVSPSSMLRQSDAVTALGLVAVLALGSVGAFLALRKKQAP
jgi:putative membrane protein